MLTHARKVIQEEDLPDIDIIVYEEHNIADELRGRLVWAEVDHWVGLMKADLEFLKAHNGRISP